MPITMKLREAMEVHAAVARLPKLPIKVAYRLGRISDLIGPALREFEKQRMELGKELGAPSEDGQGFSIPREKQPKLFEQLNLLLDEEVSIALEPVKLSDLTANGAEVEPSVLAALSAVIKEDEAT